MFVIVWQFEIAEEKIAAFEAAYGPDGPWAQLFRIAPELPGHRAASRRVRPRQISHHRPLGQRRAFRAFRKQHDADYEALDRACDDLTSRETRIGAYTV